MILHGAVAPAEPRDGGWSETVATAAGDHGTDSLASISNASATGGAVRGSR
jgi:hypothetical protein